MTDQETLKNMRGHLRDALKAIKGARWWALNQEGWDSLTMLAVAWLEARQEQGLRYADAECQAFVQQVVDSVPGLKQVEPQEPPKLPSVWRDEVTGEVARNPWSEPQDLKSQAAVAEHDPKLAAHLKATAKGTSYALLAERKEAEARHAKLAAIKYMSEMHRPEINPWLIEDEHERRQKAAELIKSAGQDVSDVYKREAEPIKIPWSEGGNMTELGNVAKSAPEVWRLSARAVQLQNELKAERKAELQRTKEEAERKLREMEGGS